MANWLFLPRNPVVVKLSISPLPDRLLADRLFGDTLALDLRGANNVTWLQLANRDFIRLHLKTGSDSELLADGFFQKLTPAQRLAAMVGNCTALPARRQLDCTHVMMWRMNVAFDEAQLLPAVDGAIQLAFGKQGRQPPASLYAANASAEPPPQKPLLPEALRSGKGLLPAVVLLAVSTFICMPRLRLWLAAAGLVQQPGLGLGQQPPHQGHAASRGWLQLAEPRSPHDN